MQFKFDGWVYDSMSQPVGNKPSLEGAFQGHVTNFKILYALKYLWNG